MRWVDTNKGDDERQQYRSRLVAQQVRFKGSEAVFAAMLPVEAVRTIASLLATALRERTSRDGDSGAHGSRPGGTHIRLTTELEAVKGQVQTECNALRDLFAQTTTAMSVSGSQHDRRLNHREAGRHLPQQFGGSRLDYGDFAVRMESYAAVPSRDGQGCALLRKVAKLEKWPS